MPDRSGPISACAEILQAELQVDRLQAEQLAGKVATPDEPQRADRLRSLLRHPALRDHAHRCLRRSGLGVEHLGRLLLVLLSLPEQDPLRDWLVRFSGSAAYRAVLELGRGRFGDEQAARDSDRIAMGLAVQSTQAAEQFVRVVGLPAFRQLLQRLPARAKRTRAATVQFIADACRTAEIYEVRRFIDLLSEEPGLPPVVETSSTLRTLLLEAAIAAVRGEASRPRVRQVLRMLSSPAWRQALTSLSRVLAGAIDLVLRDLNFTPDTLNTFCEVWASQPDEQSRSLAATALSVSPAHLPAVIDFFLQPRTRRALSRMADDEGLFALIAEEGVACKTGDVPRAFAGNQVRSSILTILTDPALPISRLSRLARFRRDLLIHDQSQAMREYLQTAIYRDLIVLFQRAGETNSRSGHSALKRKVDQLAEMDGGGIRVGPIVRDRSGRLVQDDSVAISRATTWIWDRLWGRWTSRFAGGEYHLAVLRTIAESAAIVDEVFAALSVLDPADLEAYAEHLQRTWERNRSRIGEEADARAPWAIHFRDARPYVMEALLPLVGTVPVYSSDWAKTEGTAIYLPSSISFFRDDPEVLEGNRNLTMYVFLALHEAGHLLAGSFTVNFWPLISASRAPGLYHFLYNVVEDVRIERWLEEQQVHGQIAALMEAAHQWFLDESQASNLIDASVGWIWDQLYTGGQRMRSDAPWTQAVSTFMDIPLQRSDQVMHLGDALARSLQRIRMMPIKNPAAAMGIATDLYHLLLPLAGGSGGRLPDLASLSPQERTASDRPGSRSSEMPRLPRIPNGGTVGRPEARCGRTVRSEQDLADLYREANAFPERFQTSETELLSSRSESGEDAANIRDDMNHTAADYHSGHRQKQLSEMRTRSPELDSVLASVEAEQSHSEPAPDPGGQSAKEPGVVNVHSWDPATRRRLKISEVREFAINAVDPDFLSRHQVYAGVSQRLRGLIHNLLYRDESELDRSSIGDEWDMDVLLEVLADFQGDRSQDVLLHPGEERKDARLVIGLDVSGSTSALIPEQDGPVSVLDMEKHFAMLFADAFGYLGVPVQIYGFNSITSTNIYLPQTAKSISALVADNANRDGDFIRWVTDRLSQKPAEVQYFLLISDGMPNAPNYDGTPAVEDTLMAMRECRMAGIRLIYINVDPAAESYFESFRKEASSAIRCRSAAQLPDLLPRLIHDLGMAIQ